MSVSQKVWPKSKIDKNIHTLINSYIAHARPVCKGGEGDLREFSVRPVASRSCSRHVVALDHVRVGLQSGGGQRGVNGRCGSRVRCPVGGVVGCGVGRVVVVRA